MIPNLLTPLRLAIARASFAALVTSIVLAVPLNAQLLTPGQRRQIDALFTDFANPRSPGCAVGVSQGGVPLFTAGYGGAVLEHGVAITPRTAFNLGSISKQFTAFAILLLVRDGRLSLDDDIRRHLPELASHDVPIRVRDLLYHTSGIRDYSGLARLGGRPVRDPERPVEEFIALMARQRALNFTPGTRHEYVHSDYNVLGVLIERVTAKRLGDVLTERIWRPLGMKSTRLLDDELGPIPLQALAYDQDGDSVRTRFPAGALRGGTDVYSSVEDMLRWNANFDRPVVGDTALVAEFLSRPLLASGDTIPYVHGIRHGHYRGLPTIYRGGHGNYFSADHLLFPSAKASVVVLCNTLSADTHELVRQVADVVLASRLQPRSPEPAVDANPVMSAEIARLSASYYTVETPWLVATIVGRDGTLHVQYGHGGSPIPMRRLADGRWALGPARIAFEPDASGRMQLIATVNEMDPPMVQPAWPAPPAWNPSSTERDAFTGTFYSDDVVTAWQIVRVGNDLILRRPARNEVSLRPAVADVFGADLGDGGDPVGITFVRDGERVVALEVTDVTRYEVVRRLRFDRVR